MTHARTFIGVAAIRYARGPRVARARLCARGARLTPDRNERLRLPRRVAKPRRCRRASGGRVRGAVAVRVRFRQPGRFRTGGGRRLRDRPRRRGSPARRRRGSSGTSRRTPTSIRARAARKAIPRAIDDDVAATPSYGEWSAGVASERFELKYWYSPNLYGSGETASYVDTAATFALPRSFVLELHAGYSFGDYFDDLAQDGEGAADYVDYSVGLRRPLQHVELALTYVATRVDPPFEVRSGPSRNDPRVILSLTMEDLRVRRALARLTR